MQVQSLHANRATKGEQQDSYIGVGANDQHLRIWFNLTYVVSMQKKPCDHKLKRELSEENQRKDKFEEFSQCEIIRKEDTHG